MFRRGVECRGRFVEEQDLGVAEEGAGDGDALFLAAGEGGAFCSDDGVVALREGLNEFEDLELLAGGNSLAWGRMGDEYVCVFACQVEFFLRYFLILDAQKNIEFNRPLI